MLDLSNKRTRIREQLANTASGPFADNLRQEIRDISKHYRSTKRNHEKRLRDMLDAEIEEATHNNDMALMWRLSKRRSGKLGPKSRGSLTNHALSPCKNGKTDYREKEDL